MSIIDRTKLRIVRYVLKQVGGNLQLLPQWVRHNAFHPSFSALVMEGYRGNPTAFACSWLLQRLFPEPDLGAWQESTDGELEKIANHPIRQIMRKANLDMGENELMQFAITYCSLGGNVYLWKQRAGSRKVIHLWPFHDGQMQPIPGKTTEEGLVAYYVLDDGTGTATDPNGVGRHKGDTAPGIAIFKEDIVHWKWAIDPGQPWRGMGALVASAVDVDIRNELGALVLSSLKNDATPPFVVKMVEGQEYDEAKAKRIRRQWQAKQGGARRGLPAFLENAAEIIKMGFDPSNIDVAALQSGPDAAICMGYGIHPAIVAAMVGLDSSTYSNYEEASRALAEKTLIPLWRSFASEFEQAMSGEPGFAEDTIIRFDVAQVAALQQDLDALWARVGLAFDGVIITRAEARTALGYEFDPTHDEVYKEALGVKIVPKGFLKDPEAEPPPPFGTAPPGADDGDDDGEEPEDEPEKGLWVDGIWWHRDDAAYLGITATDTASFSTGLPPGTSSQRATAAQVREVEDYARAMRDVRGDLEGRMRTALIGYFEGLASRIVSRLEGDGNEMSLEAAQFAAWRSELKEAAQYAVYPPPDAQAKVDYTAEAFSSSIFNDQDAESLRRLIQEYQLEIMSSSWDIINVTIQSGLAFDMTDPAVTHVLGMAGDQVTAISETTKDTLRTVLQEANERGWSIEQIVRGDPENGIPSIRSIVEQTYKNRDKAIARTELGMAQNTVTASRYAGAGVAKVLVFDNGFHNSHPACVELDGTIQTLAWARANPLQHPNCVRAFGPIFDD